LIPEWVLEPLLGIAGGGRQMGTWWRSTSLPASHSPELPIDWTKAMAYEKIYYISLVVL
jgi:hypothetical protein